MPNIRYLFFSAGVLGLLMAYVLLGNAQYFSVAAMLLLIFSVFASIALLGISYLDDNKNVTVKNVGILLSISVVVFIIVETTLVFYDTGTNNAFSYAVVADTVSSATAALATGAAYIIGKNTSHLNGRKALLVMATSIIIVAVILGQIEYSALSSQSRVVGTDELAVGYHAAKAFIAGLDPYNMSFAQNFANDNITPTFFLNGTCQCSYNYPAMSFLALVPFAVLTGSYNQFLPWALVATSALIIAALALVFRCTQDSARRLLLPAFIISLVVFTTSQWALVKYILIPVLVLAYIYRDRPLLYSLLLGCAASLHQIGIIAVPFFILLSADEKGWKYAGKVMALVTLVFIASNAYFLYKYGIPIVISMIYAGNSWLMPRGVTVMQFLMAFYPVLYTYSSLFFFLLYGEMLAAFYFFRKARFIIGIMTPLLFMFSSSNSITYAIPFMVLLLLMIAEKKEENTPTGDENYENHENNEGNSAIMKMGVFAGAVSFLVFFCATIAYSHVMFVARTPIYITNATGMLQSTPLEPVRLTFMKVRVCSSVQLNKSIDVFVYGIKPYKTIFTLLEGTGSPQEPNTCETYSMYIQDERYSQASRLKVQVSSGRYLSAMKEADFAYYSNVSTGST